MAEDIYQCTLDKASIDKAREELNEIPEERLGALKTFKDWIQQQPWLKTPMDPTFLLNFLRAKKFSQLEARSLLERYWVKRNKYAIWCKGIDPADPHNLKILRDSLSYVPLPGRDKNGRKVLMIRLGQFDTSGKSYSFDQIMRVRLSVLDTILRDENVQVNGIVFFMDFTDTTMKLHSWMGLENARKQHDLIEVSLELERQTGRSWNQNGNAQGNGKGTEEEDLSSISKSQSFLTTKVSC
ncbi:hypothetical protein CHS0354_016427 [Potamilus streckersoni]|uniref:CRAL/TRIO N-terminal domain-containing protein n=1 Tax=Potamilus streckersoni TaxID=2493646 RepID=A0AAE0SVB7_9BIVA|nr:hypothetical protein CHS0354_016427 [Potamilus streckersoni]